MAPATVGPATVGPMTMSPATVEEPAIVGLATVGLATVGSATVGPATVEPATVGPATVGRAEPEGMCWRIAIRQPRRETERRVLACGAWHVRVHLLPRSTSRGRPSSVVVSRFDFFRSASGWFLY